MNVESVYKLRQDCETYEMIRTYKWTGEQDEIAESRESVEEERSR